MSGVVEGSLLTSHVFKIYSFFNVRTVVLHMANRCGRGEKRTGPPGSSS